MPWCRAVRCPPRAPPCEEPWSAGAGSVLDTATKVCEGSWAALGSPWQPGTGDERWRGVAHGLGLAWAAKGPPTCGRSLLAGARCPHHPSRISRVPWDDGLACHQSLSCLQQRQQRRSAVGDGGGGWVVGVPELPAAWMAVILGCVASRDDHAEFGQPLQLRLRRWDSVAKQLLQRKVGPGGAAPNGRRPSPPLRFIHLLCMERAGGPQTQGTVRSRGGLGRPQTN